MAREGRRGDRCGHHQVSGDVTFTMPSARRSKLRVVVSEGGTGAGVAGPARGLRLQPSASAPSPSASPSPTPSQQPVASGTPAGPPIPAGRLPRIP